MSSEAIIFAIGSVVFITTTAATLIYAYLQFNSRYRIIDVPGASETADTADVEASPVGMTDGPPDDSGRSAMSLDETERLVPSQRRGNPIVAAIGLTQPTLAEVAR